MLYSSLVYILIPLSLAVSITWFRVLDGAKVELGFEHYAEKADPSSLLKMPANALVNFGYSALGFYWIRKTRSREKSLGQEAFFYNTFSWMAVLYGAVQFGRIVSQTRLFGILDQWFTLPFFAWVVCWNEFVYRNLLWQTDRFIFVMRLSILSYSLVLLHDLGFELALGLHILVVFLYTVRTQNRLGTAMSLKFFTVALLCSSGFVFLKLADHYFGQFSYFQRFTGHFWSKVADVGQIYFVYKYFESLRNMGKESKGTRANMKIKIIGKKNLVE